jgi:hypothetical protein
MGGDMLPQRTSPRKHKKRKGAKSRAEKRRETHEQSPRPPPPSTLIEISLDRSSNDKSSLSAPDRSPLPHQALTSTNKSSDTNATSDGDIDATPQLSIPRKRKNTKSRTDNPNEKGDKRRRLTHRQAPSSPPPAPSSLLPRSSSPAPSSLLPPSSSPLVQQSLLVPGPTSSQLQATASPAPTSPSSSAFASPLVKLLLSGVPKWLMDHLGVAQKLTIGGDLWLQVVAKWIALERTLGFVQNAVSTIK